MDTAVFCSQIFPMRELVFPGSTELVVVGGRDMFSAATNVLKMSGIRQIAIIGFGSQGHAHAQNLRESNEGSDIVVKVGLPEGSGSRQKARDAGFTEENGTLGETFDVISESDLVILLIPDSEQVRLYKEIFAAMRPGAILGLAHGFLLGHLQSIGEYFPDNISVIGVCPKGVGQSVRWWYEQGRETNGAGIPCSIAVEQDRGGAMDVAIAWAIQLGAPISSLTTLEKEFLSDLTGERGILLGAVWPLVEMAYGYFVASGYDEEMAYNLAVESVTGPISEQISRHGGLLGLYRNLPDGDKEIFARAYVSVYGPAKELIEEIYASVESGDEIREVVERGNRLKEHPMERIDTGEMWVVGARVRQNRENFDRIIEPMVAGLYVAIMMAQVDVLHEHGHRWTEVCFESIIEAIKSLNPLMHAKGAGYMVDSCSPTARLGTRKWGPRFGAMIWGKALQGFDSITGVAREDHLFQYFLGHPGHSALATCLALVPEEDLYVNVG
ncbi:MAG: ketol-acid reductoisomerase [Candidatus Moranbacteria bacterium]|nr:ketol-acid reductoisomerase [Candidatus Moranbacteria bacterium]